MLTPPDIGSDTVAARLSEQWGVVVDDLYWLPVGFGAHHGSCLADDGRRWFVTLDDLDAKPWLGDRRDERFRGLGTALAVSAHAAAAGVDAVVPLPSRAGRLVERVDDRWALTVLPYLEDRSPGFGARLDPSVSAARVALLARLHRVDAPGDAPVAGDPLPPSVRADLLASLDALDDPWGPGPWAARAQEWLRAHEGVVRRRLTDHDGAWPSAAASSRVITHGEPHAGNLLVSTTGLVRLVDWDTVALGPYERDLWWLDDDERDAWSRTTGRAWSPDAVACYRWAWLLGDVASFCTRFRLPHVDDEDGRASFGWLQGLDLA